MKLSRILHRGSEGQTLRNRADALREGLSRRDAVLGAAAATVPLPALASGQPAQHPDAGLIALWQRREEAYRAERTAAAIWDAIEDARTGTPRPETLFMQDGDHELRLAAIGCRDGAGRMWYCVGDPGNGYSANVLRKAQKRYVTRPVRPEDNLPSDAQTVTLGEPRPEAQARADEIVAAWDAREAEVARGNEASGFDAAKAAWKARDATLDAIEDEIAAAAAHTVAGLTIKARVAISWDERGYRDTDTLAASILAGLIALDTPTA